MKKEANKITAHNAGWPSRFRFAVNVFWSGVCEFWRCSRAMNTAVAMKADFDATFPDLRSLAKDQDRVPGRPLGELVVNGLRERGFQTSDVQHEEPFFVTRCRSGEHVYPILSYVAYPDKSDTAWVVSCEGQIGFLGRLFGRSEEKDLGAVLDAIHDTLKSDSRIREMRWFTDAPFDPFSQKKYATAPRNKS